MFSRRNKQLKARRLQLNGTTPTKMTRDLCTSSLPKSWIDRKVRTSRICHRMNSQLNSRKNRHTMKMFMRLIRIGEDYRKLKLKRIFMQIGLKRSRTVWVRPEEEVTRKVKVSVDEVIRATEIVYQWRNQSSLSEGYTKETPSSHYSFIMSWKLRTMYKSTSCLSQ